MSDYPRPTVLNGHTGPPHLWVRPNEGLLPPASTLLKMGLFVFITTTPSLGEGLSLALALLGLVGLLATMPTPDPRAKHLVFITTAFFLPLTLYDLYLSITYSFVTYAFIALPAYLISGYILSQSAGRYDYLFAFERIIFYLAVPSFLVYSVFFIAPAIAYAGATYEFRETSHQTFYILNMLMAPGPVLRNAGFASEPGFYQLLINIALYARLRRLGRADLVCVFYLLVVLSTLSTTGIVVAAFLVSTTFSTGYRVVAVLLLGVFFGIVESFVADQYAAKIENDAVFGPRFIPTMNAIEIFLENPLGFGSYYYTLFYESYDIGSWDSYTQVALRYGLLGLLGLGLLLWSTAKRHPALLGILLLSFVTSPIWALPAIAALYFPTRAREASARKN